MFQFGKDWAGEEAQTPLGDLYDLLMVPRPPVLVALIDQRIQTSDINGHPRSKPVPTTDRFHESNVEPPPQSMHKSLHRLSVGAWQISAPDGLAEYIDRYRPVWVERQGSQECRLALRTNGMHRPTGTHADGAEHTYLKLRSRHGVELTAGGPARATDNRLTTTSTKCWGDIQDPRSKP